MRVAKSHVRKMFLRAPFSAGPGSTGLLPCVDKDPDSSFESYAIDSPAQLATQELTLLQCSSQAICKHRQHKDCNFLKMNSRALKCNKGKQFASPTSLHLSQSQVASSYFCSYDNSREFEQNLISYMIIANPFY